MSEQTKGENRPIPSKNLSQVPQDAVSFVEIGPDAEGQRLDNFLMKLGRRVPKSHIYRDRKSVV